ncbi:MULTISPECIES: hypothetical protein [Sorangium]|uniref:Lipoprotein n=1 Tax=Sorangium cellulosum TaxID=56 RepID=A0A4P2R047_SORCE|nr:MULTISPECIES: hypothetical protein [Sorangium]AUX36205.1 hypothetical protein SOCE836_084120 [Sorangium cellulosum]WCQ95507.1 hypothetical protein NQZ70_08284 [Sorangium sp. Soce836]
MRPALLAALALCFLVLAGCGAPRPTTGTVVIGLTSELRAGAELDRLRVVLRAGGELLRDDVLTHGSGQLFFPRELFFRDLEDGTAVEISLEAFGAEDAERPVLVRAASTRVIGGRTLLLRVRLEQECVVAPGDPTCPAPRTCVAGGCSAPDVDPRRLEPYSDSWKADAAPDACKPAGGGAPVVVVGEGQADYFALEDLDEVQVEAGPQGGYHIFVAIRLKNLRQSGSITVVNGAVPELDYAIEPLRVIFTLDQDEGGFCKLAGLRFRLDGERTIDELLGKVVDVEVTVTDTDGDTGTGRRKVTLSQAIL